MTPKLEIFFVVQYIVKFIGVEWSSSFINKGGYVIFDSLGYILNFLFFKNPFRILFSSLKIKSFNRKNIIEINLRVASLNDLCVRANGFDVASDPFELIFID